MNKPLMKKISSFIIIITIICSIFPQITYANSSNLTLEGSSRLFDSSEIAIKDKLFLEKMETFLSEFSIDQNGNLKLNTDLTLLSQEYKLSNYEQKKLQEILNIAPIVHQDSTIPITRVFIENGKIYFDNVDVKSFLLTAAQVGPAAIYAALTALGTVVSSPVGGTIIAVLGIIGLPSLSSFCYTVIQAAATGRGAYIGVEMNGIFPNIVSGVW
ncbi:hypothetical protein NDGK_00300 [Clostridiales bacterium CHKCI001]|nr:hypothetical protein NDGK_00300 [Clostridiales bacterium CHKCI001]